MLKQISSLILFSLPTAKSQLSITQENTTSHHRRALPGFYHQPSTQTKLSMPRHTRTKYGMPTNSNDGRIVGISVYYLLLETKFIQLPQSFLVSLLDCASNVLPDFCFFESLPTHVAVIYNPPGITTLRLLPCWFFFSFHAVCLTVSLLDAIADSIWFSHNNISLVVPELSN